MVDSEDTILGVTTVALTAGGAAQAANAGWRVDAPMVFFLKL